MKNSFLISNSVTELCGCGERTLYAECPYVNS